MNMLHTLSKQVAGVLIVTTSYAQTPSIQWSNTIGGTGDESPSQIILTQDNGYLVFGESTSNFFGEERPNGDTNILVVKINSNGEIEWQKSVGGNCEDSFKQALQTEDGIVILGQTCSSRTFGDKNPQHGKGDILLLKIDFNGNQVWESTFGGSQADHPVEIIKAQDEGFMILSQTFSSDGDVKMGKGSGDVWVSNISCTGNLVWERSFGGSDRETPVQIVSVKEGGYFVLAESGSNDGDVITKRDGINIWTLRISNQGALLWQNSMGGSKTDFAKQVIYNHEGDFVILGQSLSRNGDVRKAHGSYDIWVFKMDHQGELVWQKALGGSKKEFAKQLVKAKRNGYLVSGYTESFDGDITSNAGRYDVWLVKLTELGEVEWQKSLGENNEDFPEQVVCTPDGGYLMLGSLEGSYDQEGLFDCWVVKLGPNGNTMWEKTFGGTDHDLANNLFPLNQGNYIFTATTRSKNGDVTKGFGADDIWVFKLSSTPKKNHKLEGLVQEDD